jgi:hypothetical protein
MLWGYPSHCFVTFRSVVSFMFPLHSYLEFVVHSFFSLSALLVEIVYVPGRQSIGNSFEDHLL